MSRALPAKAQRARIRLMLDQPYLAAALARLPAVNVTETNWCPTMATDGYYIYLNAEFVERLTEQELAFVFAHEVLHCVLGHIDRRGSRDPGRWNAAIDYATNLLLVEFGLTMPREGLLDWRYHGLTAEGIYDRLPAVPMMIGARVVIDQDRGEEDSEGAADAGDEPARGGDGAASLDGFDLHLDPDDMRGAGQRAQHFPTEEERRRLRRVLTTAMQSALHGHAAGLLQQDVTAATSKRVPWQTLLARFVGGLRRSDYRLFPPNRKHIWRGLYLPSVGVPGPEHLVAVIDTSGSMDDTILAQVLGEIDQLRAVTECRLTILHADATVQRVEEYEAFEQSGWHGTRPYNLAGRGGTDFRPALTWAAERRARGGGTFDGVIYLTDGYGFFPERPPPFPVLWIVTEHGARDIPFGTIIRLEK